ncbi:MAG: TRAP transporter small permease subunit [SAR324 cluster bacterium]|nr:TRAP transporter small permease subunit [SAR324 cluster bacterium]
MSMLETIVRIYDTFVNGLAAFAGLLVGAASLLIVIDVTIRSMGYPPPAYTIAVVEYGLLYITMLSAPYLVRERGHVYIDAIVSRLPDFLEIALVKIAYTIAIASSLTFTVLSAQLFQEALESGYYDEQGVDMPYWSLYMPIPFGLGMVAIEFARYLFSTRLMHRENTDVEGSL